MISNTEKPQKGGGMLYSALTRKGEKKSKGGRLDGATVVGFIAS